MLKALELTNGALQMQLQAAQQAAVEVTRNLQTGKREVGCDAERPRKGRMRPAEDDGDFAIADAQPSVINGFNSMNVSGGTACPGRDPPPLACYGASDGNSVPPMRGASSMGSEWSIGSVHSASWEEEALPMYRSARPPGDDFSTPTPGEDGAYVDRGAAAAPDLAEFDGCHIENEEAVFRSVCGGGDEPLDADDFLAASEEEAPGEAAAASAAKPSSEHAQRLLNAVAAVSALAEPGVLGAAPSDDVVAEQLAVLTAALKAFL